MLIKALLTHSYGGKRRAAGTEFEAPAADAKILTQLRRAAYVTLAEPAKVEPEPKEKPKRAYKRRDMKAED